MSLGFVIAAGLILLSMLPKGVDVVRGFAADPSFAQFTKSFGTLVVLASMGLVIYFLIAGFVNLSGISDPAGITARIRNKQCWLVKPEGVEVHGVGLRQVERVPAKSVRTVLAMEVPTRRGIRGRVVDLSIRRDGTQGVAASMFVVTDAPTAHVGADVLATLREGEGEGEGETGGANAVKDIEVLPSPIPDAAEPVSYVGTGEIVLSGSPFEPKLLADARVALPGFGKAILGGLLCFGVGLALAIWAGPGFVSIGALCILIGFSLIVIAIYARWRASPSRWIARAGSLRIERYTRPFRFLGPSVRTIRAAKLGGVQATERQGVPVLEVRKGRSRKPCAILVPDELGGRDPATVAAAIEAMVRRSE